MRIFLAAFVFITCCATPAWAGVEGYAVNGPLAVKTMEFADLLDNDRASRKVPIKVHFPVADGPWPLIVFSHGAGGNWDANLPQSRHLASHGYIVMSLEHVGSNTAKMKSGWRWLKNIKDMTRDSVEVLTRPRDVSFAIDRAVEWNDKHPTLKGRIDINRVGVIGHSFGAYTTLVSCGARPALNWLVPRVEPGEGLAPALNDPRVKACVALSPQGPGEPFFIDTSYADIHRPVLGITGSRDKQQESTAENRRRFFELIPPKDKYFIWLANADHTAFSDATGSEWRNLPSRSREAVQPIARATSLIFFNLTLKQQPAMAELLSESALRPLLSDDVNAVEVLRK